LKQVVLRDCELDDNGLEYIVEALNRLSKITGIEYLDLSGNFFEKEIKNLFHCFIGNKTIKKLVLQKMNINKINIESLLMSLLNNDIIEHLDVSNNPIKSGTIHFREFFSVNHTLKFLALNNCDLNDYYLEDLLDTLHDQTLRLEELELNLNMFTSESSINIKYLFEKNCSIRRLSLLYNKLTKSDLEKVLRKDDLAKCEFSEDIN